MVDAHAEISDPTHPADAVVVPQQRWILALVTDLATDLATAARSPTLGASVRP